MLLDTFEASMETAINDMAQRPRTPKPQTPAFSAWGVVRGAGRSVPAGVAETGASGIELMSGLSKVDISAETMRASQTEEGRMEMQRRAQETLETGFRGNDVSASLRNVAEDYMPDPLTAHGAEMAVAEFGRLGTKALTAGVLLGPVAGAIVSGAEEGFTEAEKLARQGVDVKTRTKVGAVTGALTGLGFALPVAGKTVAGTVGLAVAGGPLSFAGQNAATREILDNAGYDKLADQYDPFDPVGLTLSTLVPLGFGAMAMRSAARARGAQAVADAPASAVDEQQVDAARVNLLRENLDAQRLTGTDNILGAEKHNAAVARAIDQMAAGERVDVSDMVGPDVGAVARAALDQRVAAVAEPPARTDLEIQQALAERIDRAPEEALAEYSRLKDTDGGRILNTDEARELSPEYRADRTRSAAVHEPASAFVKRIYAEKLAKPTPDGYDPVVLFTAGGTGAGKSTALRVMGDAASRAEIIYDTNMNTVPSAVQKVEQALAAGRDVRIAYVYRDPVDALVGGALPRATRMGRTVPIREHARTHAGAAETMRELAKRYAGDPRVSILAIDNSRGRDGVRAAELADLPLVEYNGLERSLQNALQEEFDQGRISREIYRGTAGSNVEIDARTAGAVGELPQRVPGQSQEGTAAGTAGQAVTPGPEGAAPQGEGGSTTTPIESPAVARAAMDLEASNPDLMVQLDGMDAPVRLADLMAQVRQEVADDLAEVPLIETAATCFLRS